MTVSQNAQLIGANMVIIGYDGHGNINNDMSGRKIHIPVAIINKHDSDNIRLYLDSTDENKSKFIQASVRFGDKPKGPSEPKKPHPNDCLLYTSPSPRDKRQSRMPSSA